MLSFSVIIAPGEDYPDAPLQECVRSVSRACRDKGYDYEITIATKGDRCEARNRAGFESDKDILIFFDDGAELEVDCVDELLRPFNEHRQVGVVGGPNITSLNSTDKEKQVGRLWASSLVTGRSSARYTPKGILRETDEAELQLCNCAISRKAFNEAGGFPLIYPNEENILYNRIANLGYKLIYNPRAIIYHDRTSLFMPYFRKMFWYGTGRGFMIRRGDGPPRMMYSINRYTLGLVIGWFFGSLSYIFGVVWGFVTYRRKK